MLYLFLIDCFCFITFSMSKPPNKYWLDLFLDNEIYGDYTNFVNSIKGLGVKEIDFKKLGDEIKLPRLLLHKKVLGNAMILTGRK